MFFCILSPIILSAGGGSGAPSIQPPTIPLTGNPSPAGSAGGTGGIATVTGLFPGTFEAINGQVGEGSTNFDLTGGDGGSTSSGGPGGFGGTADVSTVGSPTNVSGTPGVQPGGGGGGASVDNSTIDSITPVIGTAGVGAPGLVRLTVVVAK